MKKTKKRILFITGTRADYGKLKPLMKVVEESISHELYIFVAGMHLLNIFGSTYDEIIKDGYKNIHVAYGLTYSSKTSVNLGNTISHLTGYVDNIKPDLIVVHGDRIDALAGAIVGALNNISVAHVEGGEVSGTIDESIRHAITKFAHLHLVSNEEAKKRVVQLGEDESNVFVIGSPDIDIMLDSNLPSIDEVKKHYDISFNNYGVMIYHPVTTEYGKIGEKIKKLIEAVLKSNKKYVVIYPNNDLGYEIILNEYSRLKNHGNFIIHPSMRFEYFLTLLKNAEFLIGNSSAGIRESGIYGIPTINIGTRQNGRFRLNVLKNIQHVEEDVEKICKAISQIDQYKTSQMHFGSGDSKNKFIEIILNEDILNKKLQKKFVDIQLY